MKQIGTIVKQLFFAYPNVEASEGTIAVYIRMLSDIPLDELQMVVDQAIASKRFLPTIAELREVHRDITRPDMLSTAEAWQLVMLEVRRTGSYGKPQFADPAVAKCVESIGWREICISENPDTVRAHFLRMYEQLVHRQEDTSKLLPGIKELAAKMAVKQLPGNGK